MAFSSTFYLHPADRALERQSELETIMVLEYAALLVIRPLRRMILGGLAAGTRQTDCTIRPGGK
jgi:hypothetical protein